ncbi:MAG: rhomboid family intramembrane serine protease [Planctomycetota bacterium]
MRLIGSLPDENSAEQFCDFLAAQDLEAVYRQDQSEWSVWCLDNNAAEAAKLKLTEFVENRDKPGVAELVKQGQDERIPTAEAIELNTDRGTENPRRKMVSIYQRAPVTLAVIWVCIFVALLTDLGQSLTSAGMQVLSFCNPVKVVATEPAAQGYEDVSRGELWRLVTPNFVHFGPLHLAFSLFMLFQLGWLFETHGRSMHLAIVLLATAVIGNIAQYCLDGWPLFGGMSGPVFGLVAFAWVRMHRHPTEGFRVANESLLLLLVLLLVGFVGGLDGLIDESTNVVETRITNWSHLFGMVTGGVLAFVLPGSVSVSVNEKETEAETESNLSDG